MTAVMPLPLLMQYFYASGACRGHFLCRKPSAFCPERPGAGGEPLCRPGMAPLPQRAR